MPNAMNKMKALLHHDAAPGVLLISAALLAMIMDNSPLSWLYDTILETPVVVQVGALAIDKPLLLWINDGLMAIFFFLVGLEIKRELLEGKLATWKDASLPLIAAIGGMAIPALIFVLFNQGDPEALQGWAIPAATDIAFALGILALLGPRIPISIKIFLLALAIIDDLGAIIIIALFYTADVSVYSLGIGAVGAITLFAMNMLGVKRISFYAIIGIIMWVAVLKSGVHATLAGVIIALCIPLRTDKEGETSPLRVLEHSLHPWVGFGVMPIFAFANAGVSLAGLSFSALLQPIPLGIMLGLFIGKQIGVFGFSYMVIKTGICRMPEKASWAQIYGVSLLAGIGFTMSLFIGTLAFSDPAHAAQVRLGVLSGSTLSAILGYCMLRWASNPAGTELENSDKKQDDESLSSITN